MRLRHWPEHWVPLFDQTICQFWTAPTKEAIVAITSTPGGLVKSYQHVLLHLERVRNEVVRLLYGYTQQITHPLPGTKVLAFFEAFED